MSEKYTSKNLDHLGLVAAMYDELEIGEVVDAAIEQKYEKKIPLGTVLKAIVLNGLGFTTQPMYLTPKFFENLPTERLLGEGIKANQLHDGTLGRALDSFYNADVTQLFSLISHRAMKRLGLRGEYGHLDSTSIHVHGSESPEKTNVIKITKGYSRDHRPDLNQVALHLIVEQQTGLPFLMKALSGNSSDVEHFREVIEEHVNQLQTDYTLDYLVGDAALYTEATLQSLQGSQQGWLTRVPRTLNKAQQFVESSQGLQFERIDDNYRFIEKNEEYGGVVQRWFLFESKASLERGQMTVARQVKKALERERKALKKVKVKHFACEEDASKEIERFRSSLKVGYLCEVKIKDVKSYNKSGRPSKKAMPKKIEYMIEAQVVEDKEKTQEKIRKTGLFILATSECDSSKLSAQGALTLYKKQSQVEKGFRFLKSPSFLADSLFLKSPQRLMALLMVMTLCLLVYSALEWRIREELQRNNQSVPNQKRKATQTPTARWIFQLFAGIHVLQIGIQQERVLNLKPPQITIIEILGSHFEKIYSIFEEEPC